MSFIYLALANPAYSRWIGAADGWLRTPGVPGNWEMHDQDTPLGKRPALVLLEMADKVVASLDREEQGELPQEIGVLRAKLNGKI